jgi:hypothetical protein
MLALIIAIDCLLGFRCRQCHHRTALGASLATLATSCGRPREMKATRQSLGSHTSRWGIRFWRSVAKRFLLLVLPLVFRLPLIWTSSEQVLPFQVQKRKILPCALRLASLDEQFACSRPQPSVLYFRSAERPDRSLVLEEPMQPMKGTAGCWLLASR